MGRMPVPLRPRSFNTKGCPPVSTWGITRRFHRLSPGKGLVAYALRTRAPLSGSRRTLPVRLACIRPAASVHPEPGSNSSLYYCCTCKFPVLGFRCCFKFTLLASYAGFRLSKNFSPLFPAPFPSGRKRLQNYSFFRFIQQKFKIFFKKFSQG